MKTMTADERGKLATMMSELEDEICRLEESQTPPRGKIRGLKQRFAALREMANAT